MMVTLCNTSNLCETFETILHKCKTLNHVKQLQAALITFGHHSQAQFFTFKLLRFCVLHLSNLHYAHLIFSHFKSPNVYLYSAIINAYASKSNHFSVLSLYKDMVNKGRPRPNHFIYPHVLKSGFEVFGMFGMKMIHTQIVKTGFGSNPIVQTGLVDCYCRFCSDYKTARQLFDEMCERNIVSWTAMISGYARVGKMGSAILLFDEMPERDVPSWNAIIAGCTQNGLFPEAILYLRRMLNSCEPKVKPNEVTLACALSACGQTGMLQLGKEIHGYVYRTGIGSDSHIFSALIDTYGKCGCLKEARRVFNITIDKSLATWNAMINCYALHGQSTSALDVFEDLMQIGNDVRPDEITFVGLLSACTHGGLVEKGYYYFDLMTKVYGIEHQIQHYGCIVDLLGRAGRFGEVMGIINGMKIKADEMIWSSLLNGCKIHGNIHLAEFAISKLIEIDPRNGGYISMLANLYVEMAKWDQAHGAWRMLKEQNAQKIPGCSWIEVDCRVHQFHSADETHPRAEEIYSTLGSLFDTISQEIPYYANNGDFNLKF
ncbi:pentatricopeptide repeat-containing protein At1g33350 [Amaranthus tricolor]|uniref:pentatricopeptide repeat-containing protein At1g33350 n=1 Tax=Amaranthus tricolor TaxID=29722 RepID=UPI0025895B9A|nr:pentatricopeptide repeat-containing protein At1g33350 [Amaranthus tricolor]